MARTTFATRFAVGTLIVFLAAVSVLAVVGYSRIPDVDVQLPPPLTFELTIADPLEDATIFLNDNVNIKVDTHTSFVPKGVDPAGLGTDQYEFWVDDTLVSTSDGEPPALDRGRYAYTLWIPWEATEPGLHTLVVRGKSKYWNAVSNVVHVNVVDLVSVSAGDPYVPQAGETLNKVAEKFEVSPILLGAANPSVVSLEDPLPADKPIYFPEPFEPIDTPPPEPPEGMAGGESAPPVPPMDKLAVWLNLRFMPPDSVSAVPPAAPTLFRFKEGCGVTLYLRDNSNNEMGFYIYRLDPGSTSFKRLATFGPHSGDKFIEYKDNNLYGKFQYYAAAFNAFGESSDSFTNVDFTDKGCIEPRAADYKLNQVSFSADVPVDETYCYYSIQESDWSRLPAGPDSFFHPLNGAFNLSDQLSTVRVSSGSSLALECWGWSGGSLIFLGTGRTTVDPSQPQVQLRGDQFTITGNQSIVGSYPTPVLMDIKKKIVVRPPENLLATNKIEACISHGPPTGPLSLAIAILCKSAFETGSIVLVWEWAPPIFPIDDPAIEEAKEIDGYYVYKYYPGGKPVLIKTINDPKQKVLIQPAESSLKLPTYFVRAFRNIFVSGDSNHHTLSMGGSAGLATVTLDPLEAKSGGQRKVTTSKMRIPPIVEACTGGTAGLPLGSYQIVAGFIFNVSGDGCNFGEYSRGLAKFDLSPVEGPVSSAKLSFVQKETANKGESCARTLGIVTTAGPDLKDFTYDFYESLPVYGYAGSSFNVDVTSAVRNWTLGTPNNGFLFVGPNESLPPACGGAFEPGCIETEETCWTGYGDLKLTVTYLTK